MLFLSSHLACFLSFIAITFSLRCSASPKYQHRKVLGRQNTYAPTISKCPGGPLVRPATGLSDGEQKYLAGRKVHTVPALENWLKSVDKSFSLKNLPSVSLVSSGGGYRSMLLGGGLVQSMDARESNESLKGLYQALTYHAGLSGGSWLLSSIAGNNQPTISQLKKDLWQTALSNNSLYPLNTDTSKEAPGVTSDTAAKAKAGFIPTVADAWGRFLAYQTLFGPSGGVAKTMSSITETSNFKANLLPYPIITALGVDEKDLFGRCDPPDDGTQYEFTPYEFGSWDRGVHAFTPVEILGSSLSNGKPSANGSCIRGFENLGYIMGTSSNKFQESCGEASISIIASVLQPLIAGGRNATRRDLYAPYPNPFLNFPGSPAVATQPELYLVDGGEANQNNPIWPFLQITRQPQVLIVNDNSADTDSNFPNGTEILHTYEQARLAGLTRMPFIPSIATFIDKGLNKRAVFFGCNNTEQLTIVYLPNTPYGDFNTGVPSSKFDYTFAESDAMVANGAGIATQGRDPKWAGCLGCAVVMKTGEVMPEFCKGCLEKYCFVP